MLTVYSEKVSSNIYICMEQREALGEINDDSNIENILDYRKGLMSLTYGKDVTG